jgi:tetratricopeptide (TPR) repeat protein
MQDCLRQINQRIDLAASTLRDPTQRQEYDRLLSRVETDDGSYSIEQRMTRRQMAEKNFLKAQELAFEEEYYSAIVLLRQAVDFAPDHVAAWYLLGSCQQRNPKWIRHAIESYHRALAIDPSHVDALLSLGDLYRAQGLTARAQSCFEDVLQIANDHPEAKSRLKAMKK